MSVAIVRDSTYLRHSNALGLEESAERLLAVDRAIAALPFRQTLEDLPARDATHDELGWIHTDDYIRRIAASEGCALTSFDSDTAASEGSYAAAIRAAGGAVVATESVLTGRHAAAFAFVRPPGHHAEADRAMGFCLFNNVAVAAEYARRVHGLRRIAIVDWDVHHGNGTMNTFYATPEVLCVSLHEYPGYPGTGAATDTGSGPGQGYTINIPFPGKQRDDDYLFAFDRLLLPVLAAYRPELFLVSAGFDAHALDPIADMELSSRCFGLMTRALQEAATACSAPLAMVLEGGYNMRALAEAVANVLEALSCDGAPGAEQWRPRCYRPSPQVSRTLRSVRAALSPYWTSLPEVDE